jgi:hypothetical protein
VALAGAISDCGGYEDGDAEEGQQRCYDQVSNNCASKERDEKRGRPVENNLSTLALNAASAGVSCRPLVGVIPGNVKLNRSNVIEEPPRTPKFANTGRN